MDQDYFRACVKQQMISALCLEVDPLTEDQKRLKCLICTRALGDHKAPYLQCPTSLDHWGLWRYSKKKRFRPYKTWKRTMLYDELPQKWDDA